MAFDASTVYAKYLQAQLSSSSDSGCSGCSESSSSTNSWCECCPPGLVEVKDGQGNRVACMTPNDAQEFMNAIPVQCGEGFVALYKEGETPLFRGCVSESEFAELYAALNPAV